MLYLLPQPLIPRFKHVRLLREAVTLYVTALTAAMNKTVVSTNITNVNSYRDEDSANTNFSSL